MKAFIFDTETTGLIDNRTLPIDKQPEIIEFFGHIIDLDTGDTVDEIDALIKPKGFVSAEITKITGITPAMVADAPPFIKFAPDVRRLVEASDVVIAHNLSFDTEMTDIEFERLGGKVTWPRKICTVEATIHIKGFRMNLSGMHDHLFGETFGGAHRARVDVMALTRCVMKLYKEGII